MNPLFCVLTILLNSGKLQKKILPCSTHVLKLLKRKSRLEVKFRHKPDYSMLVFGFFHMYDFGVSCAFIFCKKIMESSVMFLRNDVLILNGKENKEAGAICFELRVPRKKNRQFFFGLSILPNIITQKWG